MKKRVTGIGGVFFKSTDPKQTMEWYQRHLGLNVNAYGTSFGWRKADMPDKVGLTTWCPFPAQTKYFAPSEKEFMINFRVEDLAALLEALREEGVTILGEIQVFDYGKFAHIMDADGNKIELWEPVDGGDEKLMDGNVTF